MMRALFAGVSGLRNHQVRMDVIGKETKALAINWDDELVKATCLTKDGAVVHPMFQPKAQ